jgi:hypothetical protein
MGETFFNLTSLPPDPWRSKGADQSIGNIRENI